MAQGQGSTLQEWVRAAPPLMGARPDKMGARPHDDGCSSTGMGARPDQMGARPFGKGALPKVSQ